MSIVCSIFYVISGILSSVDGSGNLSGEDSSANPSSKDGSGLSESLLSNTDSESPESFMKSYSLELSKCELKPACQELWPEVNDLKIFKQTFKMLKVSHKKIKERYGNFINGCLSIKDAFKTINDEMAIVINNDARFRCMYKGFKDTNDHEFSGYCWALFKKNQKIFSYCNEVHTKIRQAFKNIYPHDKDRLDPEIIDGYIVLRNECIFCKSRNYVSKWEVEPEVAGNSDSKADENPNLISCLYYHHVGHIHLACLFGDLDRFTENDRKYRCGFHFKTRIREHLLFFFEKLKVDQSAYMKECLGILFTKTGVDEICYYCGFGKKNSYELKRIIELATSVRDSKMKDMKEDELNNINCAIDLVYNELNRRNAAIAVNK